MVLTAVTWLEVSKSFILILFWIILPVFLVAAFITSFFHYRKKKRNTILATEKNNSVSVSISEKIAVPKEEAGYIYFDHSDLVKQYKKKLSHARAKNIMLEHDIFQLKANQNNLNAGPKNFFKNKTAVMESTDVNTPISSGEQKQLLAQLDDLKKSYKLIELENESLKEQVKSFSLSGDQQQASILTLHTEKKELKKSLMEQEWLSEAMKEKRAEIFFLQNQLEQRVKDQHLAEIQRSETLAELDEIKKERQATSEEIDNLKTSLENNQSELKWLRDEHQNKDDQVIGLSNQLKEIKEQNELLLAQVNDKNDEVNELQEKISLTESRLTSSEQKLANNKKIMRKLFDEFSNYVDRDNDQLPAITPDKNSYPEKINEGEESVAFYPV